MNRTPGKWHIDGFNILSIIAENINPEFPHRYVQIATCGSYYENQFEQNKVNAAFIVKAVNNHDVLVEALKEACEFMDRAGSVNFNLLKTDKFKKLIFEIEK